MKDIRQKSKKSEIAYQGVLKLKKLDINCYVLSNGSRMLKASDIIDTLGFVVNDDHSLLEFVNSSALGQVNLNYNKVVTDNLKPVSCQDDAGETIELYPVDVLVDICDAILEARANNTLPDELLATSKLAEILIISFASIGTTALIDEAVGYKPPANTYQELVKQYIDNGLDAWLNEFGRDYFENVCRLNHWQWSMDADKACLENQARLMAEVTNELVYKKLPLAVVFELEKLNKGCISGDLKLSAIKSSDSRLYLINHINHINCLMRAFADGEYHTAKAYIDQVIPDANHVVG